MISTRKILPALLVVGSLANLVLFWDNTPAALAWTVAFTGWVTVLFDGR
jgi:hypothetical protein